MTKEVCNGQFAIPAKMNSKCELCGKKLKKHSWAKQFRDSAFGIVHK